VSGELDEEPGSAGAGSSNGSSGAQVTGSSGASAGGSGNGAGSSSSAAGNPAGGSGNTPAGGSSTGSAGSSTGNAGSPNVSGSANGGSASGGGTGGTGGATHDCKRGIGWHGAGLTNAEVTSKITWWYTWGVGVQNLGAGLEHVPMVWGGGSKVADINKNIRADAKYLLGYNEPNFYEQANLSAQQAASDWPTVQSVAQTHDLPTVSPAVNFCGNDAAGTGPCHDTNPVSYLQDFFAACQGCKVDYVAVHWYNCDGASLEWYLDQFTQFNRPIWLTEFACAYDGDTSVAGQEKYMREAIPILEGRADIFRYAWFSGDPMPNARLLNTDGSFTNLGKIYADLPRDPTCTP
jgi:hypothetical protein